MYHSIEYLQELLDADTVAVGRVDVDEDRIVVTVDGRQIEHISKMQWDLLMVLWRDRPRVVSRDEIVDAVWPDAHGVVTDGAVDALIQRLRVRLTHINDQSIITTVRGHGFQWVA